MDGRILEAELIALAEAAAARPGGRERVAAALRAALATVETSACLCLRPGVAVAVGALSEYLTCAQEHAEFLRAIIG